MPARLTTVLTRLGIETPTPIQSATLPDSVAGRDVLGRGRTGSGKTYAFLLPVVARLADGGRRRPMAPRALIVAPTRELVGQIESSLAPLAKACGLTHRSIYGGVGFGGQISALARGVDIIIACPGRLEDLIRQGHCTLEGVEITVLDEADHLADLGFLPSVRRLLEQTPQSGQRLLFSATLDRAVDSLVKRFLVDPVTHEADSENSPVATMHHHVLHVEHDHRLPILIDLASAPGRTMVFTRTKRGAKTLARKLNASGVPAVELHGDLAQGARSRNLAAFHDGRAAALVATDVAARGIHVDGVALVVHADPPTEHKAYLHRSGRTARAGSEGTVVTLVTREHRKSVQNLTRAAGIEATTTRVDGATHPVLVQLAPGERSLPGGLAEIVAPAAEPHRTKAPNNRNRRRGAQGRNRGSQQASGREAPRRRGAAAR